MMKSAKNLFSAFLTVGALAGAAGAAEYQVDTAHSEVIFKVRHMGISTVTGRFGKIGGSFDVDPKNIQATKGSLVIEVASVNTNNNMRDKDLKSDKFFDVEKFPEMKYVSKAVKDVNMGDSTCTLIGDLTLHGVTKEIALKVKGGGIINDGWGNERAAFTATGRLNRFDYGLKWNKAVETGSLIVSENVDLLLSFEGVRKAPAAEVKPAKLEKTAEPKSSEKKQ